MLKAIGLAVALTSILGPNSSALADARSAAEFVLKICLPAMDDLSNVERMALENNWTRSPPANLGTLRTRNSRWDVTQGEDRFSVQVWTQLVQDFHVCFVSFPNNNVNRGEFLTFIDASVHLTLISDTWFAQTKMRSERYDIKNDHITSDRAKPVEFDIISWLDAKVDRVGIIENFRPVPTSPEEANR
jgi:hypothetical protein